LQGAFIDDQQIEHYYQIKRTEFLPKFQFEPKFNIVAIITLCFLRQDQIDPAPESTRIGGALIIVSGIGLNLHQTRS
jgi:hypothetical protein